MFWNFLLLGFRTHRLPYEEARANLLEDVRPHGERPSDDSSSSHLGQPQKS